jgi:hypothetical protein
MNDIHDLRFNLAVQLFEIWRDAIRWDRAISDLGIEFFEDRGIGKIGELVLTLLDVPPDSEESPRDYLFDLMYGYAVYEDWEPQRVVRALHDAAQEE